MTIFSGDIIFPVWGPDNEIHVKGSIIVYPEQTTGIIIGSQVVEPINFECSRSNTSKIGSCTINIPDANATIKDLIDTDDEIFIYYKDPSETEPVLLWRGFVETMEYSMQNSQILVVKGNEISKILFETKITKTYTSEEISDIVIDLLNTNAPLFDTSKITATERSISVDFEEETLFNAIQTVLNPFNHRLLVYNDFTVEIKFKEHLSISIDDVDVNNIEKIKESTDIVAQYNKVTVQGKDSSITYTASKSDVDRIKEIKLIKPELHNSADVEIYAKNILENNSVNKKKYSISTELLYNTTPGMLVYLDYPTTTLDGSNFEVRTITHFFSGKTHRSSIQVEDDTRYFEELITGMNQGLYKTMLKTFE